MIGDVFGIDQDKLVSLYLGLVVFGIAFNKITAWAEKKGYTRGFLSLFVAFGAGMTILATAFINPLWALFTLGAFIASGSPMITGSISRYLKEREEDLNSMREEAKGKGDGDPS